MGRQAIAKKDRTCLKCGEVIFTTAKGIKQHASTCCTRPKGRDEDEEAANVTQEVEKGA